MTNPSDRLLVNLTIVGNLLPHQRINAKSELLCVESPTILPEFFIRWWRADDRSTCLRRINEIIEEAKEKIHNANVLKNTDVAHKFLNHVANARPGLRNMKQTYANDMTVVAHLDLLGDMCNDMLRTYNYEPPQEVIVPNELSYRDNSSGDTDDDTH
jgi:hypothetical protein